MNHKTTPAYTKILQSTRVSVCSPKRAWNIWPKNSFIQFPWSKSPLLHQWGHNWIDFWITVSSQVPQNTFSRSAVSSVGRYLIIYEGSPQCQLFWYMFYEADVPPAATQDWETPTHSHIHKHSYTTANSVNPIPL